MLFDVHFESRDGRIRVVVRGELDLATRERLRAAIADALGRSPDVILDLRGVAFIDSTGLQTLLELDTAARTATPPRVLTIVPGEEVRRVLKLTALEARLTLADDEAAAGANAAGNGS